MKTFLLSLAFIIIAPLIAFADAPDAPEGLWIRSNETGWTKIQIDPADNDKWTGTIAAMENPRNDTQNPDPDLRDESLIGRQLFDDMTKVSQVKWEGSLYNPENGNTYSGSLTVIDQNELRLKGCVFGFFCRTDTWLRVVDE